MLLHLGTLVAVFVAYWAGDPGYDPGVFPWGNDLAHGTTPTPMPPARRMILLIIVGTLPLFVVLPVKDFVEGLAATCILWAVALLVTGCLLFASDRVRKGRKTERSARIRMCCWWVGAGHRDLPRHFPLRHHHYRRLLSRL